VLNKAKQNAERVGPPPCVRPLAGAAPTGGRPRSASESRRVAATPTSLAEHLLRIVDLMLDEHPEELAAEPAGVAVMEGLRVIDDLERAASELVGLESAACDFAHKLFTGPPPAEQSAINGIALSRTEPGIAVRSVARVYRSTIVSMHAAAYRKKGLNIATTPVNFPGGPVRGCSVPPDNNVNTISPFKGGICSVSQATGNLLWPFGKFFRELAQRLDEPLDFHVLYAQVWEVALLALLARPGRSLQPLVADMARVAVSRRARGIARNKLSSDALDEASADLAMRWMKRKNHLPTHNPVSNTREEAARNAVAAQLHLMEKQAGDFILRLLDPDGVKPSTKRRYRQLEREGRALKSPVHRVQGCWSVSRIADALKGMESPPSANTIRRRIDKLESERRITCARGEHKYRQVRFADVPIVLSALGLNLTIPDASMPLEQRTRLTIKEMTLAGIGVGITAKELGRQIEVCGETQQVQDDGSDVEVERGSGSDPNW
jgi:hypothetical protein